MSSREYNPCGRNDDDREQQALYVEDASDNENEDAYSMSSREYDDDPQEGAAHYVYTGEDRYWYHRGPGCTSSRRAGKQSRSKPRIGHPIVTSRHPPYTCTSWVQMRPR